MREAQFNTIKAMAHGLFMDAIFAASNSAEREKEIQTVEKAIKSAQEHFIGQEIGATGRNFLGFGIARPSAAGDNWKLFLTTMDNEENSKIEIIEQFVERGA